MFASRVATFLCVSVAWVFFRVNDLGGAADRTERYCQCSSARGLLRWPELTIKGKIGARMLGRLW
jgi:hypothetical protein